MKVVVYGGSNSFIGKGYTFHMREAIISSGLPVDLVNCAMGNTFVHYGLTSCLKYRDHIGADVAILEYAINDQEIFNEKAYTAWAHAYEGLIRIIKRDNPLCRVVSLILYARANQRARMNMMAMRVSYLTSRCGGEVVDVQDEFDQLGLDPSEAYADASHYTPKYHEIVGKALARRLLGGAQTAFRPRAKFQPVYEQNYENAKTIAATDLFAGARCAEAVELTNSRVTVTALKISRGCDLKFKLDGELIAITYAATTADGLVRIRVSNTATVMSAYRGAFEDPRKSWPFLTSILLPALATRDPLLSGNSLCSISVVSDQDFGDVKPEIYMRGTQRMPDPNLEHSFHLMDILYTGSIASVKDEPIDHGSDEYGLDASSLDLHCAKPLAPTRGCT